MADRKAHNVDYQQRALGFAVGDEVFPFMFGDEYGTGRVVEVYPAIGVVNVEYPNGTKQEKVEDLQRVFTEVQPPPVTDNNVPGGAGGPGVSGGPGVEKRAAVRRIAEAFVKKSIYWAARDRKYRATQSELEASNFTCPKCREGRLQGTIYKRSEGISDRLLGCPTCLFLIKSCDIAGHPDSSGEG